jgi:monofunctional biosynthetic peptidoglycan transglycosylase
LLAWVGQLMAVVLLVVFLGPPLWVLAYRYVDPPWTVLMVERRAHGYGFDRRWTPLDAISPAMVRAVVAAEDSNFCRHHGFDLAAIDKAMVYDRRHGMRLRGGSTISQQTAKNVFLWPGRDWVRKGAEAWFTVLIEALWGKPRIMEVYLNTVEMGPGVYGVGAAAERYFHTGADALTTAQASRLAAVLPSPLAWSAGEPGPYVRARTRRIDARQQTVLDQGLAACVGR